MLSLLNVLLCMALLDNFICLFSFVLKQKKQKFKAPIFSATNNAIRLKSPATRFAQTTEIFTPSVIICFTPKACRPVGAALIVALTPDSYWDSANHPRPMATTPLEGNTYSCC